MRAATPWAACLPLNGQPLVLANPDSGAEGQFFVSNLVNCPLHVVNGGQDPLYPAAGVAPLVAMFKRGGVAARAFRSAYRPVQTTLTRPFEPRDTSWSMTLDVVEVNRLAVCQVAPASSLRL